MRKAFVLSCGLTIAAVVCLAAWTTTCRAAAVEPEVSPDYVIIKLQDPAAASYAGGIAGYERTKPLRGKFNPDSPAARAYLKRLERGHANYRSWMKVNARKATVVRDLKVAFNGIAVKLNGENPEILAKGPGVKDWAYSVIYHPTMNVSTKLIGADALWGASPADAGKGIAVAVIDSGIQDGHPFFACKGQGDIPAIVHHGPYYSGETPGGPNNPYPTIVETHGTHVAGTIGGCVSDLSVIDPDGPITGQISGVAPGVTLHDFNVFPGVGAGFKHPKNPGTAFSHDIAAAIEDAVAVPVDVINMSLGGGVQGVHDYLAEVSDAAVDAGVVVVAAAGNTGPGDSTCESPGSGRKVIAVGAVSNPHFIGIPVTVDGNTYGAVTGEFNPFDVVSAEYTVTEPANGCEAITTDLTGKIALIDRGVCTFGTKVRNAMAAGAVGVLIVNNRAGDPIQMALDTATPPAIPAAMLSKADGTAIKPAGAASIDGTDISEFISANGDILADFSSHGPSPFSYLIKPEVMAPGVNVYSSVFEFGPGGWTDVEYDFDMFQGTSMATPHVAGSVALLLLEHPDWKPVDVRSALVNTAARTVTDTMTATTDPGVQSRGGGRVALVAANTTPLLIKPATVSFGQSSGNETVNASTTLTIKNISDALQECSVAVTGPALVTTSETNLSLDIGQKASVKVTLSAGKSETAGSGDYEGDVVITCGATELRVPWWVRIERKGKP